MHENQSLRMEKDEFLSQDKKNKLNLERMKYEHESQVQSLNMIIDDYKLKARDALNVEQLLESRTNEVLILKTELEAVKSD